MGRSLNLFKIVDRLVLEVDFSDVVVILPSFCLLVEERGIFISLFEPKTTSLNSLVLLFPSQC